MDKKAFVVVGLGFGDEGKGLATDYLCCRSEMPLVIRFNGGHQAGHTVVTAGGKRHMFSSFGSGTFQGVPTYWSNFCTFSPAMLLAEYEELRIIDIRPNLLLDLLCPVTTHYDVLYNRALEATRGLSRYGSCGLGFGATIKRHQVPHLKLFVHDLSQPVLLKSKLQAIRGYYKHKINSETKYNFGQFDHDEEDRLFSQYVEEINILSQQQVINYVHESDVLSTNSPWRTYIFEGAQGILLDKDFGAQPYITYSNTTSKNALQLISKYLHNSVKTEIFYITRCYQTRHGGGPFVQNYPIELINNKNETNVYNKHQGVFRTSYLDIDSLNYALKCDSNFSSQLQKHLIITCLDQIPNDHLSFFKNGTLAKIHYKELPNLLNCNFTSYYFSFSNCSDNLK